MLITSSDQVVEVNFNKMQLRQYYSQVMESIEYWKKKRLAHIDIFEVTEVGKKIIINNTYKTNCLLLTSHLVNEYAEYLDGIIEPNSQVVWKVGKKRKRNEGQLISYVPPNLEVDTLINDNSFNIPEDSNMDKRYKKTSKNPRYLIINEDCNSNHLHLVPTSKVRTKNQYLL